MNKRRNVVIILYAYIFVPNVENRPTLSAMEIRHGTHNAYKRTIQTHGVELLSGVFRGYK